MNLRLSATRIAPLAAGWVAALSLLASHGAVAQAGANRPLVLKVAYPPGGPADVAARQIQGPLQAATGQTVIVENAAGASGSIGATTVLNAPPDGQTLLVTTGNDLILAPMAISQIRYQPESYRLLTPLFPTDFALVTTTQHAFAGLDDLVEQGRKRRDKPLSVGSWGYGSAPYLVAADFSAATGVPVLDVPYKGAAPVVQALLGQQIDMAFVPLAASVVDLIKTGKVKAIGVASLKRNPHLPDVPTLSEGRHLKNFAYTAWAGVFAPATVSEAVASRLQKDLVQVVGREEFARFLKESAALPVEPMTLDQAAAYYAAELEKFRRIAKAVKLEPQ
jgi:tripartite-type tricarboxylate transporter receptor subunit TctC